MWPRVDGLRTVEFGAPGEMREWLTNLVLDGSKRATAGLLEGDYDAEDEEVEHVGERLVLLDTAGAKRAVLEVTKVDTVPMRAVTWEFADAEGEGFRSIEHWREAHTAYWATEGYTVNDETPVVCVWFSLIQEYVRPERLRRASSDGSPREP